MEIGSGFGRWLARRLRSREMTPADLARRMDVPNGSVSRWMTGARRPSYDTCERIADALLMDAADVRQAAGYAAEEPPHRSERRTALLKLAERVPEERLPWAISVVRAIVETRLDPPGGPDGGDSDAQPARSSAA